MPPLFVWHIQPDFTRYLSETPRHATFELLIRSALVTQSHDLHRVSTARQLLADRYNLKKNADMRILDAERFFGASNWDACYTITSR